MSFSVPRVQSTLRTSLACSKRTYSVLGYVPHQATQDIDPVTPRTKPPPFFYTGKPNYFATINKLQTELFSIRNRLRQTRVFPIKKGMPEQPKNTWKWKDKEEFVAMLSVTTLKKTEYEMIIRNLERLVRARHVASCVSDLKSVARITELITPYFKIRAGGVLPTSVDFTVSQDASDESSAQRTSETRPVSLDEFGRSHTKGTRKGAKADVWMIPTKAFAEQFNSIAEKKRQDEFLGQLKELIKQSTATEEKAVASAAKNLAPVWARQDEIEGAIYERESKRLATLGLPVSPRPVIKGFASPIVDKNIDTEPYENVLEQLEMAKSREKKASPTDESKSDTSDSASEPAVTADSSTSNASPIPTATPAVTNSSTSSASAPISSPTKSTEPLPVAGVPPIEMASNNPDSGAVSRNGKISITNPARPPLSLNSDPELGSILINNVPIHRYFNAPKDREVILRPFKLARLVGAFNVFALAKQGGTTGQAEAIALAVARGLGVHQPMAKTVLQQAGLLGVDHRQVERKKTGRPKARKANQWVKR